MQRIDSFTVRHRGAPREISIYHGDLADISKPESVDVLVVSAFPNDYAPTPTSLIGALARKGMSVARLAQDKAEDYRPNLTCWISKELGETEQSTPYKRIMCFEPLLRGHPADTVSDIFQGLIAFAGSQTKELSVAMPIVATGDQHFPIADMLEPLMDAAIHWIELGLPLKELRIATRNELRAAEMKGAFAVLKRQFERERVYSPRHAYDLFISYSHSNKNDAEFVKQKLEERNPGVRIFLDRAELQTGVAWQQAIYDALDQCRKVLAFLSPEYLQSKMCREEFNIAMLRQRDSGEVVLVPIYLRTTELPTYMKLIQHQDCRESDQAKLEGACKDILTGLGLEVSHGA